MRNKFSKIVFTAIAVNFALSMAFASIPGNCMEEIITLSRSSGFDMQKFTTNLPTAVAKAKLMAKSPDKPNDNAKTDIGMTFGCVRAFPESPVEIASLLKDISQKAVSGAATAAISQVQPQYAQPQEQSQYTPPEQYQYQQAQVSQYPPQAQYQYPHPPVQPQYPPPQVFYIYLPQQAQTQCKQVSPEPKNFSTGQRWGTWFLNTVFPGLGSAVVMGDYVGMGIQMALTGLGITSMTALGFSPYDDCYSYSYDYNGNIYCSSRSSGYEPNEFFVLGTILVGTSAIFNIFRSSYYGESEESYASSKHNGFNLAVLPNRHGEVMPYLLYNKTF